MQESDKPEFAELLTDVHAFWRRDVSDFTLDVWWAALEAYDLVDVRRAMTQHAKDPERGSFCPMPADVTRILGGTKVDRAVLAWSKVLQAIEQAGYAQDVVFDDPAIHAALQDLGPWPTICATDPKDLRHVLHRFSEAYKVYVGQPAITYPRIVRGDRSPDSEFEARGIPIPKPVLIGDKARALLVLEGRLNVGAQIATGSLPMLEVR